MFDIGFVELIVISVVALVVLGPERLPGAARTLGAFVRKARQGWNSVRGEFERQIAVDEVKRTVRDVRDAVESDSAPAGSSPRATNSDASTPAPGKAMPAQHAPHD